MELPFLKKKKEKKDFFLSLIFKPYAVGVILFQEQDNGLLILSSKEEQLDSKTDDLSETELIDVVDRVVTFVEQSLPENEYVQKTIFGVPYDFVTDGKIEKDHLEKFKKVCEELELIPVGFIVNIEAIVHFIQKKEGVPVTSIFVEIAKKQIFIYLVRAGNIIEVKSGEIEESLAKTLEKTLKNVETFEVLPSKIILLDYEGVENIQQEFISHPWTKSLPFLHLPQVVSLEKGFENEAIINGVAVQMGLNISIGTKIDKEDEKNIEKVESPNIESFGFVKEKDVAEIKETERIQTETVYKNYSQNEKLDQEEFYEEEKDSLFSFIPSFFGKFQALRIPGFLRIGISGKAKFIAIIAGLLVLFGLFLFVYYSMILRADAIIFIDKKTVDKNLGVTLSTTSPTDPAKQTISVRLAEVEEEDKTTRDTTGKKETGDKAKGEVTIYSRLTSSKTFSEGTIIKSSAGSEFTLSKTVNTASSSADASASPSTVKVAVTAKNIGTESNLPSGMKFSISSYDTSDVVAKNDSAFSGGTKKEITAVSKKDMEDIQSSLIDSLKQKAINDIKNKAGAEDIILPTILSTEFVNKNFDKKEGDEASKLTLSAKIKYTGGVYDKSDLNNFIESVSKDKIPQGYSLSLQDSKIELKDIKFEKDKTAKTTLIINAIYYPQIDKEKIKNELQGKNESSAQKSLSEIKNVSDTKLILKNKIPLIPIFLFNENNINIIIKINA